MVKGNSASKEISTGSKSKESSSVNDTPEELDLGAYEHFKVGKSLKRNQDKKKTTSDSTVQEKKESESVAPVERKMTAAEQRHMAVQKSRMDKRIQEKVKYTYREKVEKLNKHLSELSEHFDQPRICG